MNTYLRVGAVGAMVALLGLTGCIYDRGYDHRGGRDGESGRHEDRGRDNNDCRGHDGEDRHCRDEQRQDR